MWNTSLQLFHLNYKFELVGASLLARAKSIYYLFFYKAKIDLKIAQPKCKNVFWNSGTQNKVFRVYPHDAPYFSKEIWTTVLIESLTKCSRIELRRFFRHKFFVFNAMSPKLCKEQQMYASFAKNRLKYSDFIAGKYFLRNKHLSGPYFAKKSACSKKMLMIFFDWNFWHRLLLIQ